MILVRAHYSTFYICGVCGHSIKCIYYRVFNSMLFHLQFNFVGKLLGPKGNSMKRLQEETMTKMAVLGRGSMRDKQKVNFQCGNSSILWTLKGEKCHA